MQAKAIRPCPALDILIQGTLGLLRVKHHSDWTAVADLERSANDLKPVKQPLFVRTRGNRNRDLGTSSARLARPTKTLPASFYQREQCSCSVLSICPITPFIDFNCLY